LYYNDFINEFSVAFEGSFSNIKSRKEAIRLKKLIKKQMKNLAKIIKKISKLDGEELSLDDLGKDDSSYIKKEKYEKRAARCAHVLLNLQGTVGKIGRQIEKKFKYTGTEYPEINEVVSLKMRQIMSSKFKSRLNKRPIYSTPQLEDIAEVVNHIIAEKKLDVPNIDELCQKIEKDVIREIHARREIELEESWNDYLDDEPLKPETFPDLDDPVLNRILNENAQNLKDRLVDLFAEYQKKFEKAHQNRELASKKDHKEILNEHGENNDVNVDEDDYDEDDEEDEDEEEEDEEEDDDDEEEEDDDGNDDDEDLDEEDLDADVDEDEEECSDNAKRVSLSKTENKEKADQKYKTKEEDKERCDHSMDKVNKSSDSECEVIEINKTEPSATSQLAVKNEQNGKVTEHAYVKKNGGKHVVLLNNL